VAAGMMVCARCRGTVIFCQRCKCANQIWASFCRGCREPLRHITEAVRNYQPVYSGQPSTDPFWETTLDFTVNSADDVRLINLEGSLLLFWDRQDNYFQNVRLFHPHASKDPLDILPGQKNLLFSGSAIFADGKLWLASSTELLSIRRSAISATHTANLLPFTEKYPLAQQAVLPLPAPWILCADGYPAATNFLAFNYTSGAVGTKPLSAPASSYVLLENTLWCSIASGGSHSLRRYDFNSAIGSFKLATEIPLHGYKPVSAPVGFGASPIYLLATTLSNNHLELLKWITVHDDQTYSSTPMSLSVAQEVSLICPLHCPTSASHMPGSGYVLLSAPTTYVQGVPSDEPISWISSAALDLNFTPAFAGTKMAAVTADRKVVVLDLLGRMMHFATPVQERILAAPILWGELLFILSSNQAGSRPTVKGFDLRSERKRTDDFMDT